MSHWSVLEEGESVRRQIAPAWEERPPRKSDVRHNYAQSTREWPQYSR